MDLPSRRRFLTTLAAGSVALAARPLRAAAPVDATRALRFVVSDTLEAFWALAQW